jgi:hypothetical protein
MAKEMKEYIVGPMPPQQFLNDFFPTNSINHYGHGVAGEFHAGCYNGTVTASAETQAYDPFVSL